MILILQGNYARALEAARDRGWPEVPGEKGKTPAKVEYWMSYPLVVDCPTCGKTYDYSDAEGKFWQKELPPPPPGYSNRLAPPSVQNRFTSVEN